MGDTQYMTILYNFNGKNTWGLFFFFQNSDQPTMILCDRSPLYPARLLLSDCRAELKLQLEISNQNSFSNRLSEPCTLW